LFSTKFILIRSQCWERFLTQGQSYFCTSSQTWRRRGCGAWSEREICLRDCPPFPNKFCLSFPARLYKRKNWTTDSGKGRPVLATFCETRTPCCLQIPAASPGSKCRQLCLWN
jgi:hypothetical protein